VTSILPRPTPRLSGPSPILANVATFVGPTRLRETTTARGVLTGCRPRGRRTATLRLHAAAARALRRRLQPKGDIRTRWGNRMARQGPGCGANLGERRAGY